MTNTYHNIIQNQAQPADFGMDLSLAIRANYAAANSAPGPRLKKELLQQAARLEALKRAFATTCKLAETNQRLAAKTRGRVQ